MKVAKPELINTPRLNQLIQDGKLNLSLEDAISLGLENNLAIAVERYVPWLDEASLLLSKSGVNGRIQFDPTLTSTLSIGRRHHSRQQPTVRRREYENHCSGRP